MLPALTLLYRKYSSALVHEKQTVRSVNAFVPVVLARPSFEHLVPDYWE